MHPQLGVHLPQPGQLGPLVLTHRAAPVATLAAGPGAPVTPRALIDAQLPSDPRDRPASLEHQPYRTLPAGIIQLPIPAHRPSVCGDVSTLRGEAQLGAVVHPGLSA